MSENGHTGEQRIDEFNLIIRAKEGDKDAFAELFNIYKDRLMAFAIDKTQNAAEAEELVQESFTRFWKILPEYETTGSLKNFLYTILKNRIRDVWARKRVIEKSSAKIRESYIDGMHGQPPTSPESHVTEQEKIKNIEAKIETLDEQDRIIFRLYFIDGLSYAEIAKQLKMKLSTVHGRIIRLRKMFKEVGKEIDKKEI